MGALRIGIDLGGTKTEGVLLDGTEILERLRAPTPQQDGYDAILARIVELVERLRRTCGERPPVGVCTPGAPSPATGRLRNSNTLSLNDMPVVEDLAARLEQPIAIENDANCFALAEALAGAGVGAASVFGVILGTGVGGGIVLDGKIRQGRLHIAGEWGHHTLHPDGDLCYCGRRGCVETYLCGPALERDWAARTGEDRALADLVADEAALASPAGLDWKGDFLTNLGIALGNVINILDPDVVVLGGGVSNIDFLYTEGRDAVHANIFSDVRDTPIVRHQLGDSAGVVGAALLPPAE